MNSLKQERQMHEVILRFKIMRLIQPPPNKKNPPETTLYP